MDAPVQYLKEVRGELSLYPTWLPSDAMELGSYGTFVRGRFVVSGRLADHGITIEKDAQEPKKGWQKLSGVRLTHQSGVEAEAGLVDLSAGASLAFEREFSWAMGVSGIRTVTIRNIGQVNAAVLAAFKEKTWKAEWLLVTEIRQVARLNLFIASSENVRVGVKGEGTVEAGEVLFTADSSFAYEANDVFCVKGEKDTTPLFGLHKIQGFFSKENRPMSSARGEEQVELLEARNESFGL